MLEDLTHGFIMVLRAESQKWISARSRLAIHLYPTVSKKHDTAPQHSVRSQIDVQGSKATGSMLKSSDSLPIHASSNHTYMLLSRVW